MSSFSLISVSELSTVTAVQGCNYVSGVERLKPRFCKDFNMFLAFCAARKPVHLHENTASCVRKYMHMSLLDWGAGWNFISVISLCKLANFNQILSVQ